jgi:predicted MFS family arabinose efflux permease
VYLIVLLSIAIHACYIGSKVVVSLLALDLGASQLLIGVLASLYAVLPLALGLYSGRLADTIGMRVPMLIGAALTAVAMLCGFLWQSLPALFATAILMGAAFVFYNVSIQNLAGAYGRPEQRARNFSILTVGYSMSTFLGPMIAGFSIDYAGHARAFLVFALLALIPLSVLTFYPRIVEVAIEKSGKKERRAFDLLRDPPLRNVIIMSGLMVAAYELFGFYMPVFGHSVGLSASTIGLIMGTYATATFLTRFLLPFLLRSVRPQQVLFAFMLLAAAGFLLMPFLRDVYLIMLATFAIGVGLGVGQPISMTLSFNQSPAGRTGEVTGLRLTANNIARIVIPLTAGALGSAFGIVPVF